VKHTKVFPLSFPHTHDTIVKTIPIHIDLRKQWKNPVFCCQAIRWRWNTI